MKALTFTGGVHPPQSKGTQDAKTVIILPKKDAVMIFPMLQHIGAPCRPLVSVGDSVLVGQKIGDSEAFVSSPVHSTVSGKVIAISPVLTPGGITSEAVHIQNDGEMNEHPSINTPVKYELMKRQALVALIREAGIVGLGGAGFPAHVKYCPPEGKSVDTLIINATECEPFLTTDHRVLLEETDRILLGFMVVLSLFPGAKGYIGIETNKPDAIQTLEEIIRQEPFRGNLKVVPLKTKYPQGSEKQLIKSITGREVPSGGLPADVGCIVNNVDTFIAIHRAVFRGRPLMRRILTLAGGAIKKPGNYKIRLGMTYADMIEAVGGFKERPYKMVNGGPMMGTAMFTLDVPVVKTSSAFLAFTEEEGIMPPEHNCIRCGYCVSACPAGLMPLELNQSVIHGKRERFLAYNGLDCVECGSCSYVCPAKRHLAQSIRSERRGIMAENQARAARGKS